jgi:hypothetical protein
MTDDDALGTDMRRLAGPLAAVLPAADQGLLDRLLDGRLESVSAPSG